MSLHQRGDRTVWLPGIHEKPGGARRNVLAILHRWTP